MAIKHNVTTRYCASPGKSGVGVILAGAAILLLAGCSTLFDAPQPAQDVSQDTAIEVMSKLSSTNVQDEATNEATKASKTAAANATGKVYSNTSTSESKTASGERKVPSLSFERVKADMPQLAVWGLDEAKFLVDDEQIELGKMTQAGRIALIAPGRHRLQVKCPFDPPFSADFYLEKGDRAVLRGHCSSAGKP